MAAGAAVAAVVVVIGVYFSGAFKTAQGIPEIDTDAILDAAPNTVTSEGGDGAMTADSTSSQATPSQAAISENDATQPATSQLAAPQTGTKDKPNTTTQPVSGAGTPSSIQSAQSADADAAQATDPVGALNNVDRSDGANNEGASSGIERPQGMKPSIDVVRVEPDGSALIAGVAAPGALVQMLVDGVVLAQERAGSDGKFAAFLDLPESSSPRVLTLAVEGEPGELSSDQQVIVGPTGGALASSEAGVMADADARVSAGTDLRPEPGTGPDGGQTGNGSQDQSEVLSADKAGARSDPAADVARAGDPNVTDRPRDPGETDGMDRKADRLAGAERRSATGLAALGAQPAGQVVDRAGDGVLDVGTALAGRAKDAAKVVGDAAGTGANLGDDLGAKAGSNPSVSAAGNLGTDAVAGANTLASQLGAGVQDRANQLAQTGTAAVRKLQGQGLGAGQEATALRFADEIQGGVEPQSGTNTATTGQSTAAGVAEPSLEEQPEQAVDAGEKVALQAEAGGDRQAGATATPTVGDAPSKDDPAKSISKPAPQLAVNAEQTTSTGGATPGNPTAKGAAGLTADVETKTSAVNGASVINDANADVATDKAVTGTEGIGEGIGSEPATNAGTIAQAPATQSPTVLMSDATGVRVLQGPGAGGDGNPLGSISYSASGDVVMAGRGQPGQFVRIYLNDLPVGVAKVGADGNWKTTLSDMSEGMLRFDVVDGAGKVSARIETPFSEADFAGPDTKTAQSDPTLAPRVDPQQGRPGQDRPFEGTPESEGEIGLANRETVETPVREAPSVAGTLLDGGAPSEGGETGASAGSGLAGVNKLDPSNAAISSGGEGGGAASAATQNESVEIAGERTRPDPGSSVGGNTSQETRALAQGENGVPAKVGNLAPVRQVTVERGSTLWAIARDRYGEGMMFVRVFEANRDLIRDPDLIYPGQVFALPE